VLALETEVRALIAQSDSLMTATSIDEGHWDVL
jgi:hypothetical protein